MSFMPVATLLEEPVNRILHQVFSLDFWIDVFRICRSKKPTQVCVYDAVFRAVWVAFAVCVPVMCAMHGCPPQRRALPGKITSDYPEVFDCLWAFEGTVRQQAMITNGYAQHVPDVGKKKCYKESNRYYTP